MDGSAKVRTKTKRLAAHLRTRIWITETGCIWSQYLLLRTLMFNCQWKLGSTMLWSETGDGL